jgi:hypothetical protein
MTVREVFAVENRAKPTVVGLEMMRPTGFDAVQGSRMNVTVSGK